MQSGSPPKTHAPANEAASPTGKNWYSIYKNKPQTNLNTTECIMNSVLVIDHNAATRTALQKLLTLQWPHIAVITAETGPKGLHLAHEMQPDVILLESGLPGLDSYQTAKVLRHLPETQFIPLIAIGQNQETSNSQINGLQNTCNAWLTGPIVPDDLVKAITSVRTSSTLSV